MSVDTEFYKSVIARVEADLAALEPQRIALTGTLQNVRELLKAAPPSLDASATTHQDAPRPEDTSTSFSVPRGTFTGMTNKEAVIRCLQLANRSLAVREVARAIEGSGYKHTSHNYWNVIQTTLARLKEKGKVKKTADGYEIIEDKAEESTDDRSFGLYREERPIVS